MLKTFFVLLGLGFSSAAFALNQLPGNKYFTVTENGTRGEVNLLTWTETDEAAPAPTEKYNRLHDFGAWQDFPGDNTCFDTRALVLQRDSEAPLTLSSKCYIASGLWHDPYTDADYTSAKDIEIDHVVPLKNAYISGASEWTWARRCAYGNFLGNNFHLLAVQGKANESKLDKSPDRWMPPAQNFQCQYIADWLHVKAIWQLRMSEDEVTGIKKIASDMNCSPDMFKTTEEDLLAQRQIIDKTAAQCPANPPPLPAPNTNGSAAADDGAASDAR